MTLISTQIGKEEVCFNISSGLARLTRRGRCYTPKEIEKRRKEISKSTTEPIRNRVTTEEADEFFKTIRKVDYSVILQLNKSPTQISILALLLSSEVYCEALLKVLRRCMFLPTLQIPLSRVMVSLVLATNQDSFSNDELPPKGRDNTLTMHIIVKCEDMIVARVLIDNGSALDVYPMATLEHLKVDMSLIKPSTIIIRAFDGTPCEVQGKI